MQELFSISGKVALVTGGTRGIGRMIAECYLRAGARVIISSRKVEACERARRELERYGDVTAVPADVSDRAQCERLIGQVGDELHVLVNNAGATWGAAFDEFPDSAWDKVMGLNVRAPFVLTQLARPLLEASTTEEDPARVINIGSIDGLVVPGFKNFSYSASKAALHHLTRHMAAELAPKILVNAIAPGPFPSKMMDAALAERGDEIRAKSPVGRIGRTEDVGAAAIYLAAPATTFMTGAVIPLDGGLSTTIGLGVEL
ncbi:SDR family oxidoreductase [Kutzneria chonburiensis]|uniref:SDR family oxidoreductase n=1 Tax=Kutzneria chonburiensis TaxID=1483604 RepID=A0ABV6MU94_9PSEU|nr:SDR family oxidoreductase [Kutzneria chonburiensis]